MGNDTNAGRWNTSLHQKKEELVITTNIGKNIMARTYDISDATKIIVDGHPRKICPECWWGMHQQGDPMQFLDCKNCFIDDKKQIVGQCQCWSAVHGIQWRH